MIMKEIRSKINNNLLLLDLLYNYTLYYFDDWPLHVNARQVKVVVGNRMKKKKGFSEKKGLC